MEIVAFVLACGGIAWLLLLALHWMGYRLLIDITLVHADIDDDDDDDWDAVTDDPKPFEFSRN